MVLFATVDTLLVARYSAIDLAALAVGAAAYITVFIGLMGVVLAVAPIVGQLFGAKRYAAAGDQLHQAVWLALGLALIGSTVLIFPQPFIALSRATPEVAEKLRQYLLALALALPAGLLFAAFRGFNNAVSRPKAVMVLQLGGPGAEGAAGRAAGARRGAAAGARRGGLRPVDRDHDVVRGLGVVARAAARSVLRAVRALRPRPAATALAGARSAVEARRPDGRLGADRGHGFCVDGVFHFALRRHAGGRAPDRRQPASRCCSWCRWRWAMRRARWPRRASAPARCTTRGAWPGTASSSQRWWRWCSAPPCSSRARASCACTPATS